MRDAKEPVPGCSGDGLFGNDYCYAPPEVAADSSAAGGNATETGAANAAATDSNATDTTAADSNATDTTAASNATDSNATDTTDAAAKPDDTSRSGAMATIGVSDQCLSLLAASANPFGQIKKENYFVFVDGMSNGGYSFNNITSYSELDMPLKFNFVTFACACHNFGGSENCCQGPRANINVVGIDVDNPQDMTKQLQGYVKDVCDTTTATIPPEYMLPPSGELPVTPPPETSSPTVSWIPTAGPTATPEPSEAPVTATPTSRPSSSATPTVRPSSGRSSTGRFFQASVLF